MEKKKMSISEINEILGTNYVNMEEFSKNANWDSLAMYQNLSEDFISQFRDRVDWYEISAYQKLSENLIREFQDRVEWSNISRCQVLSEDFIREFKDYVRWKHISRFQKLSEDFIREFKDKVDWDWISAYQKLSENFIREFKDKVGWGYISTYQKLSEEFILEFQYKVYWHCISKNQKLSFGFQEEFKDKLDFPLIEDNWIYKDAEFKKEAVMATGLYECHEDYFIAYKGARRDRYRAYNFQYQYLKGEIYESWCDCSDWENSFGFSVRTEDKARKHCDELVVRVKVRYSDVGRVLHGSGEIRCFKIEILD